MREAVKFTSGTNVNVMGVLGVWVVPTLTLPRLLRHPAGDPELFFFTPKIREYRGDCVLDFFGASLKNHFVFEDDPNLFF